MLWGVGVLSVYAGCFTHPHLAVWYRVISFPVLSLSLSLSVGVCVAVSLTGDGEVCGWVGFVGSSVVLICTSSALGVNQVRCKLGVCSVLAASFTNNTFASASASLATLSSVRVC